MDDVTADLPRPKERVLDILMQMSAESLEGAANALDEMHRLFPTWMAQRPTLYLAAKVFQGAAEHRRYLDRRRDDGV